MGKGARVQHVLLTLGWQIKELNTQRWFLGDRPEYSRRPFFLHRADTTRWDCKKVGLRAVPAIRACVKAITGTFPDPDISCGVEHLGQIGGVFCGVMQGKSEELSAS